MLASFSFLLGDGRGVMRAPLVFGSAAPDSLEAMLAVIRPAD